LDGLAFQTILRRWSDYWCTATSQEKCVITNTTFG